MKKMLKLVSNASNLKIIAIAKGIPEKTPLINAIKPMKNTAFRRLRTHCFKVFDAISKGIVERKITPWVKGSTKSSTPIKMKKE